MASSQQTILDYLRAQLADIERQQADPTLPHSDQHLLDQAWEDMTNQIDALEDSVEAYNAYIEQRDAQWRDAGEYLDEEEESEEDAPPQHVTIAPPPPAFLMKTAAPPAIVIPEPTGGPSGPPAPKHAVRICNCDSDGKCSDCLEEEELERWNNMVDDREDCSRCSGCYYCQEGGGYDHAGEI